MKYDGQGGPVRGGRLTAAFVKAVRHEAMAGRSRPNNAARFQDGNGLYLQVMPPRRTGRASTKQWVQRLTIDGKRSDYGLGGYPELSLGDARALAAQNLAEARAYRRARHRGESPPLPGFERGRRATVAQRSGRPGAAALAAEAGRHGLTFGEAWEACILERSRQWKNAEDDLRNWRANLKHHLSALAGRLIASVTVDCLRAVLQPLAPKTSDKVLQRTGTVFDWAEAGGHVERNPAKLLRNTQRGLAPAPVEHRKALPVAEVPAFYARLRAHGTDGAAGALALTVLTGLRSKEARLARWEECDLEARVFIVPGQRMKSGQAFRVPLSEAACRVLRAAGPLRTGLVFPSKGGRAVRQSAARRPHRPRGRRHRARVPQRVP